MNKIIVNRVGRQGWLYDISNGKVSTFDRAKTVFAVKQDINNGVTLLTEEEEEELEKKYRKPKGFFAPYSEMWKTFMFTMNGDTIVLDVENKWEDFIYHKLLLTYTDRVAKDLNELSLNPYAEFYLTDEQEEIEKSNIERRSKRQSYILFGQMTPERMRNVLIAYGKDPRDVSPDQIENLLGIELDNDPDKFLSIVEDPKINDKIFIHNLINYGILKKKGSALNYNQDMLGVDVEDTIRFLKNKKNNMILVALKRQLNIKAGMRLVNVEEDDDLIPVEKTKVVEKAESSVKQD